MKKFMVLAAIIGAVSAAAVAVYQVLSRTVLSPIRRYPIRKGSKAA